MTMKALRFEKYGPPAALGLVDVERPALKSGEALVKVLAAAINPSDVKNVSGAFGATIPRIPGRDFAGIVEEGEAGWAGKEVWGSGAGFGVVREGSHAQYLAVPIDWLSEKPRNLSMEEAAAVGVPYLVSWASLVDAADLRQGETVVVTGASGAVGRAATQIAHWRGAKVIGADRNDKPNAADMHINTETQNLPEEVKRLTDGRGADLVLDAVGGPLFQSALNSLRRGGRQVSISSVGNSRVEFDLVEFYHELRRLIGVDSMKLTGTDIAGILDKLREGFEQGSLEPPAIRTWPLSKGIEAYQAVERGGDPAKHILLPNA